LWGDVMAALDHLPDHERRALELRVLDELPYDEVAHKLTITPAAARLRVSRALKRLSQALGTDGKELRSNPAPGSRTEDA
ncbi:MAG: sigma-70 family RNA polymerase sigma factor, partial [Actinobacteria bacterium]|nr:sigma-70 family RNA polymerase sigma factor [Actinomycetota bacterium]